MFKLNTLLLFIFLSVSFQTKAIEPCATEYPEEVEQWLKEHVQNNQNITFKRSAEPYYIPVKVHIVGTNQGGGYYRTSNLLAAFCNLNQQFEETGFHFYIYGDINYINNDALYEHSGFWGGHTLAIQNNRVANVANMFFVNDPAGACGYYAWAGGNDFVAIKNSCGGPNNSTIAHEFGHYFSLPHTFNGWEGGSAPSNPERMDGSNCSTSADYFCDTPPDYLYYRWNCPYNDNILDPVGVPIEPDGKNFMSYANDACTEYFSNEQMNAMNAYLLNQKSYLLNHPKPDIIELDTSSLIFPENNQINVAPNYAQFKWEAVEGATHYHVFISRYINPNLANVDTIVSGTSIIIKDLTPNVGSYRWKVRPFNSANTCATETSFSNFATGSESLLQPNVMVDKPSCPSQDDGSVTVDVTGGAPPYFFDWSSGESGSTLQNVSAGFYELTITDDMGSQLNFFVDVPAPDPLNVEFNQSGQQLTLEVTGGTPPYNFLWNTGETGSSIEISSGEYAIEVTDNNGCYIYESITISSLDESSQLANSLKVFPNPFSGRGNLYVQFESEVSDEVVLQLYDNKGRLISDWYKNAGLGNQTFTLNMQNQSIVPGIYLLRIVSGNQTTTQKVQVL